MIGRSTGRAELVGAYEKTGSQKNHGHTDNVDADVHRVMMIRAILIVVSVE